MAWCYGKKKDCLKEEEYYRKSLEALPVGENTLNNLGYSLYKQRKFKEAQSVFEDCLRQNRDVRYAANNLVRTLLAQGKNGEAQRVIQEHERFVSKDLKKRAEKPVGKVKIAVPEPAVTDVEAETIVDIGVKNSNSPAKSFSKMNWCSGWKLAFLYLGCRSVYIRSEVSMAGNLF